MSYSDQVAALRSALAERERRLAELQQFVSVQSKQVRSKNSSLQALSENIDERDRKIQLLSSQVEKKDAEFSELSEEKALLEQQHGVSEFTLKHLDAARDPRTLRADEALDIVFRLEATIKLERMRFELLKKDARHNTVVLRQIDRELAKVTKEADGLQQQTGWRGSDLADTAAAENAAAQRAQEAEEIAQLKAEVQKLEEEARTNDVIHRKKQQLIQFLSQEVEVRRDVDERYHATLNDITVTDRARRQVNEQTAKLERAVAAKEAAAEKLSAAYDDTVVAALDRDKHFLQSQIAALVSKHREYERSLRAVAVRTEQIQGRLDALMASLADQRIDGPAVAAVAAVPPIVDGGAIDAEELAPVDEHVAPTLHMAVLAASEYLRNVCALKDTMLAEKQANVQTLSARLGDVSDAMETESRQWREERRGYDAEKRTLQSKIQTIEVRRDVPHSRWWGTVQPWRVTCCPAVGESVVAVFGAGRLCVCVCA